MGLLQDLAQDRGRFRAAGGGVREFAARWMPLGRAAFLEIWRRERAREANPLRAWAAFAADEAAREAWQKARGGGALQELHWEEALEIVAAALLHIARTYGPDRVFGLAGAPGDADPTWIGGTRFLHLFGGVALCSCEGGGAAPGIGAGGAAPGIGAGGAAPGIGVAAAGRPGGFGPGRCQPLAAWRHVHSGCWRYRGAGDRLAGEPAGSAASRLDRELQTVASGSRPFFPQFDRNPLAVASETRAAGALEPGAVATRVAQALEEGALQLAIGDPDAPANWPRALLVWQPGKGTPAGLGGDAFLKHCLGTGSEKVPIQRAGPGPALVHCRPSPRGKLDLAVGIGARPDGAIQLADILLPTGGRDVFAALAREISDLSPLAFPGPVEDLVMVPREPQPAPGLPPGDPGPRFALASRDYARLADHLGTADPGARPACAGLSWVALARLPDAGEFEAAPARGQAP